MQAPHEDKYHARMFSICASSKALATATLTNPISTGRPWWLPADTRSAPLVLAALHDQPNLFRDLCVVTIGLLHICWKKNMYAEIRIFFFLGHSLKRKAAAVVTAST